MKYPKHEDFRGFFQELAKASDCHHKIAQVSRFTMNPNTVRGGHYHRETTETFILLKGSCLVNIAFSGKQNYAKLVEGDTLVVAPLMNHTFYSEDGCEFLVLASKEFDPKDPDTFVLK